MSGVDRKSSPPAIWIGFVLMCLGMFVAILDIQVVATSLPAIQNALGVPPDAISWVQTSYLVAEIIAIPLTGWLTRALTMRWLFVAATALFTASSVGCALSESFATLVFFRVLQGFAGGALIPPVFAAVFILFAPRMQGIATTIAGIMAVLAPTRAVFAAETTILYLRHTEARQLFIVFDGDRPRQPGNRPEAGAPRWMAVSALRCLAFIDHIVRPYFRLANTQGALSHC